jgi:hypothetical protein
MEFAVVVEGNGDTNDKSIRERQISARVADATEILLSLTTIKDVMVSIISERRLLALGRRSVGRQGEGKNYQVGLEK